MSVKLVGPKCTRAVSYAALDSHGEYADGTNRQTDGQTPNRYIMLFATRGQRKKLRTTCTE